MNELEEKISQIVEDHYPVTTTDILFRLAFVPQTDIFEKEPEEATNTINEAMHNLVSRALIAEVKYTLDGDKSKSLYFPGRIDLQTSK